MGGKSLTTNHSYHLPVAATTSTAAAPAPAGIPAATSTAAPATGTTIAPATAEIIAGRTCFVYCQSTALERLSIQAGNCPLHVLALSQFDESEAPRLASDLVANNHGRSCLKARATYKLTQFTVCHFVGEVPYE